MLTEDGLDLDAEDLLAAAVDHVLDPVEKVNVAVGVDRRDVACVQPSLADRRRRLAGPAPVARDDLRPRETELAGLIPRARVAGLGADRLAGRHRHRRGPIVWTRRNASSSGVAVATDDVSVRPYAFWKRAAGAHSCSVRTISGAIGRCGSELAQAAYPEQGVEPLDAGRLVGPET
jgi:hypothetical protein